MVQCKDCYFFICYNHTSGNCHKHAPKPVLLKESDDARLETQWPIVMMDDTCGEGISHD